MLFTVRSNEYGEKVEKMCDQYGEQVEKMCDERSLESGGIIGVRCDCQL